MGHYEKQWAAYTLSKERAPVAQPGAVPDIPDNVARHQMQQADKTMGHASARGGSDDQPVTLTVTFSSRAELIRALSNNSLPTPDPPPPGNVRPRGIGRRDKLEEEAEQLLSRLGSRAVSTGSPSRGRQHQVPRSHPYRTLPPSPQHPVNISSRESTPKELSTFR
ncbi:hypothetical protein DFQ26_006573 [Actinomortierella ambigua]|nr:hypothetical protein DFQ26_006573 [Actinomortierella ambigua]